MQYTVSTRFLTDLRSPPVEPLRKAILSTIRKLAFTPEASGLQVRRLQFSDAWYCRVNDNWRMVFRWGERRRPILLRVVPHKIFDHLSERDLTMNALYDLEIGADGTGMDEPQVTFERPAHWGEMRSGAPPLAGFTPHQLRLLGVPAELARALRDAPTLDDVLAVPGLPDTTRTWLEALATDPSEPLTDPFRVFKEATLEQLEDFASGHLRDLLLKLTDDQNMHVRRSFTGTMLLKGVAGSGKTTVGLHRALQLSQAGRRVLFLTFNPVLKAVTQSLMAGVVETLPSTLQVVDYRTWILDQAAAGQGTTPISRADALRIMEDVLPVVRASSVSAVLKRPASFFVDEVERVVKGFGLTSLDDYLTTPRYGRKTALSPLARTAVWQVVEAYNARLRTAGQMDWGDVVMHLYFHLLDNPVDLVDDIIIDEAQDLTPIDLRTLQRLTRGPGSEHKSVLVLGDAAQTLYSRGFSWRQVGLDLRGRSHALHINHRNTREIVHTASELVSRNTHLKEHGELLPMTAVARGGPKPILMLFETSHAQRAFVIEEITRFREENLLRLHDIAIVAGHDEVARDYAHATAQRGIPVDRWDEQDSDVDVLRESVKVMTIQTAKGLEFPVVFLVGLTADLNHSTSTWKETDERDILIERSRMFLYVGLTRSAELLYVLAEKSNATPLLNELDAVDLRTPQ